MPTHRSHRLAWSCLFTVNLLNAVVRAHARPASQTEFHFHAYVPIAWQARYEPRTPTPAPVPGCLSKDEHEPNNSSAEAIAGPVLCWKEFVSGVTDESDSVDVYWVEITETRDLRVQLRPGLGADYDLTIEDGVGTRLAAASTSGRIVEELKLTASPGRYFFKVAASAGRMPGAGSTWYTIVAYASVPEEDCLFQEREPNNAYDTALENPPLCATTLWLPGTLPDDDLVDVYRVELDASARVRIELDLTLTGLPPGTDYDLFLFRPVAGDFEQVANSTNAGQVSELIVKDITAGEYFIMVRPWTTSTRSDLPYLLRWQK